MGIRDLVFGLALAGTGSCVVFGCFVGATRVLTPTGSRRIDSLKVGDAVWSWSVERQEPVVGRVQRVMRTRAQALYTLVAGELRIDGVTGSHPFWSPTRQCWLEVDELAVGDAVLGWLGADDAKTLSIDRLERRDLDTEVEVFDLTIEGEHDFFAEGLLVHNKSVLDPQHDQDGDGDGYPVHDDCDDDDGNVFPGAPEDCIDQLDTDCDGLSDDEDDDCATWRLLPSTAQVCSTLIVSLQPIDEAVVDVHFVGPADIEVITMAPRERELLLTLEVLPSSNEGLNDAVITLEDDEEIVLIDAFEVSGGDCLD